MVCLAQPPFLARKHYRYDPTLFSPGASFPSAPRRRYCRDNRARISAGSSSIRPSARLESCGRIGYFAVDISRADQQSLIDFPDASAFTNSSRRAANSDWFVAANFGWKGYAPYGRPPDIHPKRRKSGRWRTGTSTASKHRLAKLDSRRRNRLLHHSVGLFWRVCRSRDADFCKLLLPFP